MRAISVRALVMWMLVPAAIALVDTAMPERVVAQSAMGCRRRRIRWKG
jgi:hypothetical protein